MPKYFSTPWRYATPVEICSKTLKRSLRMLHYPSSPQKALKLNRSPARHFADPAVR
jgi:hypothetical protein